MKVLFIASDNHPSSGAFLSMVTLNKLLRDQYQVETKVVLPYEGDGQRLLDKNHIPYVIYHSYDWVVPVHGRNALYLNLRFVRNAIFNIPALINIVKLIKKEKYDLVHINTTYADIGKKAADLAHVPTVWHLREMLEEDQGKMIFPRLHGYRKMRTAERIVAISSCVYEKYSEVFPQDRLRLIFNGIDTERFYSPKKQIFEDQNHILLIYGGGYARQKGVYDLARAIQILKKKEAYNFTVLFLGEPPEEYVEYIHTLKVGDRVRFLGYQEKVEAWYKKSDIAFSCSAMEAFGRKTVEAMLCGCLMISSDTGGSLDIIQDRETGLLYRQGDPEALFETIKYALGHIQEMKEIAQNGRENAYKNFSAHKNAKEIYDLYRETLQNKALSNQMDDE